MSGIDSTSSPAAQSVSTSPRRLRAKRKSLPTATRRSTDRSERPPDPCARGDAGELGQERDHQHVIGAGPGAARSGDWHRHAPDGPPQMPDEQAEVIECRRARPRHRRVRRRKHSPSAVLHSGTHPNPNLDDGQSYTCGTPTLQLLGDGQELAKQPPCETDSSRLSLGGSRGLGRNLPLDVAFVRERKSSAM